MLYKTIERPSSKSYFIGIYLFLISLFGSQRESIIFFLPYVIIGIYILYTIFSKKITKKPVPNGLKFYLYFGLWAGLSYLWIGDYEIRYGGYIFLIITIAITIWISKFTISKTDLINILLIYSISIIPIVYLNIGEIQKSVALESSKGGGRFSGTFENANLAGMYGVSVIWCICFILFQSKFPKQKKIILACLLPFAFQLVLISGSRKAFIGIILIAIFQYWFLIKNYTKNILLKLFPATVFGIGLYYLYGVFSNSVFYFRFAKLINGESESYEGRSNLMAEAWHVWQENPLLGVGFDSFRYHNEEGMPSHSSITETLVSTGLIGFILYFSALYVIIVVFFKFYFRAKKIHFEEYQKDAQFFILYVMIFIFFNSSAILYNSRDMWPLLAVLYIYSGLKYKAIGRWYALYIRKVKLKLLNLNIKNTISNKRYSKTT